jgi:hypothetical protein
MFNRRLTRSSLNRSIRCSIVCIALAAAGPNFAHGQLETGWKAHDLSRPLPQIATPADENLSIKPPSDALILFDGSDLSQWSDSQGGKSKWKVNDGVLIATPKSGNLFTKKKFGDCQLHLEWQIPADIKRKGQGRGNSGIYFMESFEIQILDTLANKTYADGMAGAIYGQYPPLVNAARPAGKWQSYDIIFHRPHFHADGSLKSRATATVLFNGVLIQDNSAFLGPTTWIKHLGYEKGPDKRRMSLQDHGNPTRFRNIWIRELAGKRALPKQPYPSPAVELSDDNLQRLVGDYGDFKVVKSDDKLFCRFYQTKMELLALSESEFLMKKCAGKLIFDFDDDGKVKEAKLHLDAAGKRVGTKKSATAK